MVLDVPESEGGQEETPQLLELLLLLSREITHVSCVDGPGAFDCRHIARYLLIVHRHGVWWQK
ncbi:hypothetical protein RRF57_007654 [Xylaria bambusicola]|uniref:Uncharacterized protein n=1 Tax=Xylaria bambusicola TaxID=326684 RepID=A0AAN7V0V5_9PEZI